MNTSYLSFMNFRFKWNKRGPWARDEEQFPIRSYIHCRPQTYFLLAAVVHQNNAWGKCIIHPAVINENSAFARSKNRCIDKFSHDSFQSSFRNCDQTKVLGDLCQTVLPRSSSHIGRYLPSWRKAAVPSEFICNWYACCPPVHLWSNALSHNLPSAGNRHFQDIFTEHLQKSMV